MTLFEAVAAEDLLALEQALSAATDVNVIGPGRTTPLIEAAQRGWADGVARLLEAGAEPSWRDETEETALLKAAANGHREVLRLLWPLAGEADQGLARAFLAALGAAEAPEYRSDEGRLKRAAAEVAAGAAEVLGYSDPARRMARIDRAGEAARKGVAPSRGTKK